MIVLDLLSPMTPMTPDGDPCAWEVHKRADPSSSGSGAAQVETLEGLNKLGENLLSLYHIAENTDVVINIDCQEIHAHKLVHFTDAILSLMV